MSTQQISPNPTSFPLIPSVGKTKSLQLTARQRRFATEYVKCGNGSEAARLAGYSAKSAGEIARTLLLKPHVKVLIDQLLIEVLNQNGVTTEFVIGGIKRSVLRCEQSSPVLDKDGKNVIVRTDKGDLAAVYQFDAPNVFRGYELLGKYLKLFSDRLEIDIGSNLAELLDSARRRNAPQPALEATNS
jgi:phage terminase small subunit